eukprot:3940773-Rhodomonas_salina.4
MAMAINKFEGGVVLAPMVEIQMESGLWLEVPNWRGLDRRGSATHIAAIALQRTSLRLHNDDAHHCASTRCTSKPIDAQRCVSLAHRCTSALSGRVRAVRVAHAVSVGMCVCVRAQVSHDERLISLTCDELWHVERREVCGSNLLDDAWMEAVGCGTDTIVDVEHMRCWMRDNNCGGMWDTYDGGAGPTAAGRCGADELVDAGQMRCWMTDGETMGCRASCVGDAVAVF